MTAATRGKVSITTKAANVIALLRMGYMCLRTGNIRDTQQYTKIEAGKQEFFSERSYFLKSWPFVGGERNIFQKFA